MIGDFLFWNVEASIYPVVFFGILFGCVVLSELWSWLFPISKRTLLIENAELKEENQKLRKALKPFADKGRQISPSWPENCILYPYKDEKGLRASYYSADVEGDWPTVEDYRNAGRTEK